MSTTPKIAIIGAGPAGLMLSRLLHINGIPSIIFEKDPSAEHRISAGGCLDLREGGGQKAFHEAQLWDEFQKYARYDAQSYIFSDETGNRILDMKKVDMGRPEIDRVFLRKILLESIPKEYIYWDHRLESVDEVGTLHFEKPSKSDGRFDLVVGADGAWSKIRQAICYIPPFYAGLTGFEMWIKDPDTECPDVAEQAGIGSYYAFGNRDGKFLSMQRQSDRSIQMYAYMQKPELWVRDSGIDVTSSTAVKAAMLKEYSHWSPDQKRAIEAVNGPIIPRSMYMMHVGTRWLHKSGLTLVGDAAHLMTPFAGEGVNAALHDSLVLARAILSSLNDLDQAVQNYEQEMFPRAEGFQRSTWDSLRARFEKGGTLALKERFEKLAERRKEGETNEDGVDGDKLWAD